MIKGPGVVPDGEERGSKRSSGLFGKVFGRYGLRRLPLQHGSHEKQTQMSALPPHQILSLGQDTFLLLGVLDCELKPKANRHLPMPFCTILKPVSGLLRSKPTKDRKPGTATAVSRLTGSAGSFSDGLTRAGSGRYVLTRQTLSS